MKIPKNLSGFLGFCSKTGSFFYENTQNSETVDCTGVMPEPRSSANHSFSASLGVLGNKREGSAGGNPACTGQQWITRWGELHKYNQLGVSVADCLRISPVLSLMTGGFARDYPN